MRTKFLSFFTLIAFASAASILNSWIIQHQFHGGINFARAISQIILIGLILYTLWWHRGIPSYILALGYAIGESLLYGYELTLYFLLGDNSAKLPTSSVIVSLLIIVATLLAVVLIGLDYFDYRKRQIPNASR
jgi:hypothetical protein